MVFTIYDAGFVARCALEVSDATQNRLQKIMGIVAECRYGIHDVSRTALGPNRLPRFNMPMELGIFLGSKEFGVDHHRRKACLILDTRQYRYQKFISDIAGQDVHAHKGSVHESVVIVRDWLRTASHRTRVPGGERIWGRYQKFRRKLPEICRETGLRHKTLAFLDYTALVEEWLLKT